MSTFTNRAHSAIAPVAAMASHGTQKVSDYANDGLGYAPNQNAVSQVVKILVATKNGLAARTINLAKIDALSGIGSLKIALELAKVKAEELSLPEVAIDIEEWIKHHPWEAAFYTASALGLFAPEILSIPALEALGFGATGVRAGSVAAKVQSVIGPVAARSVFAIWQSARMGGYGVANVNGGVRGVIALADAAVAKCNPLKDCKGLMSDGGAGSRGGVRSAITMLLLCTFLTGMYNVFGRS